jgi:hypothetical protein
LRTSAASEDVLMFVKSLNVKNLNSIRASY